MSPEKIFEETPNQYSENIISSFRTNLDLWEHRVSDLIEEEKSGNSASTGEVQKELDQLVGFLKRRLFKRLSAIKKYPEELRLVYLRCLEPFFTEEGIAQFMSYYYDVEVFGKIYIRYRKKKELEKEVNVLVDLYKVKKTIETITTLQKAVVSDDPFHSRFTKEEQVEFLKTLKDIFKLFFFRFVKQEYRKKLFNALSEKQLEKKKIIAMKKKGLSFLQPQIFKNTEHRDKFITVFFSTLLRTKTSSEIKDLHFNYLNFELLKNEFLTDWIIRKLKGNEAKNKVLQTCLIGSQTVADMISENPEKEAEILQSLPIGTFNDMAEQINQNVKETDKMPIPTLSKKHGPLARIEKNAKEVKDIVQSAVKKTNKIDLLKKASERANRLIEKMTQNIEVRNEASEAIESFIDDARKGVVKEKEIKGYIDEMIGKTSPDAIGAIASLKGSDQTYGHCVDVSGIFTTVCSQIISKNSKKSIFKDNKEITFASFMHDFGKAKIPKDILDSTAHFEMDGPEMKMIRSHPIYGVELLQEMNQPDHIQNIVRNHHVKFDSTMNSSYPKDTQFDDLLWETKLLAVVDVYQALIGKRSYKKSWTPAAAVRYLENLCSVEFDPDMFDQFVKIIGLYPVGSLVELSDGSMAYVMNVPADDLEKPQVVAVQSAEGKPIENHSLINLQGQREITITKNLDAQEIFGEKALDIFTGISLN